MQKNIKIKSIYSVFAILALSTGVLVSGCAKNGSLQETKTPEDIVKERATERWNYMISRDFDRVYEYTDSSYRLVNTVFDIDKKYGGKKYTMGVNWTNAEFSSINCEDKNRCQVKFLVDTITNVPPSFRNIEMKKTIVNEVWVKEDDNWYYYMKK